MKKYGLLLVVAVVALGMVAGTSSAATIAGSKHDLSTKGWGTTQICIFCHTPHNALSQLVPLWNHGTTAATFTLYASSTLNALPGQPAGVSKACLSCHDGTIAIDSYGSRTGTNFISGNDNVGTNLGNDHPISFTYDGLLASADGGLNTPPIVGLPLYSGNLECASCHDVHNKAGIVPFLRSTNVASALCLKCHIK